MSRVLNEVQFQTFDVSLWNVWLGCELKGTINISPQGQKSPQYCSVQGGCSSRSAVSSIVSVGMCICPLTFGFLSLFFFIRSTRARYRCQTLDWGRQCPRGRDPQWEVAQFSVSCTQTLSCPSCRLRAVKRREKGHKGCTCSTPTPFFFCHLELLENTISKHSRSLSHKMKLPIKSSIFKKFCIQRVDFSSESKWLFLSPCLQIKLAFQKLQICYSWKNGLFPFATSFFFFWCSLCHGLKSHKMAPKL